MLENNFLFLTIALLIILTAVFVGYMRGRVDSRDYVFHKLRYLFTYASLKTEILIGTGIVAMESFFRNERKEVFGKCPLRDLRMKEVRRKEQRLREIKELHGTSGIRRKENINLKILR